LDIEALKNKITDNTKLIVITNLHNPSGILTSPEMIQTVAELAQEHDAFLFIDEMFLDVANTEQAPQSAFGLDSVLVTASVSKVFGIGGLRTGWIIAPKDIAKKCLLAKWQASVAAPYLSELIVAEVLSKARKILIERCKNIARQNFPIVEKWIKNNIDLIEWVPPTGGIMCFPQLTRDHSIDIVDFCNRLVNENGVLVSPGKYFGTDGHIRLTFMNQTDELNVGLNAIIEVLRTMIEK